VSPFDPNLLLNLTANRLGCFLSGGGASPSLQKKSFEYMPTWIQSGTGINEGSLRLRVRLISSEIFFQKEDWFAPSAQLLETFFLPPDRHQPVILAEMLNKANGKSAPHKFLRAHGWQTFLQFQDCRKSLHKVSTKFISVNIGFGLPVQKITRK
jgi:hypothetical protein